MLCGYPPFYGKTDHEASGQIIDEGGLCSELVQVLHKVKSGNYNFDQKDSTSILLQHLRGLSGERPSEAKLGS